MDMISSQQKCLQSLSKPLTPNSDSKVDFQFMRSECVETISFSGVAEAVIHTNLRVVSEEEWLAENLKPHKGPLSSMSFCV